MYQTPIHKDVPMNPVSRLQEIADAQGISVDELIDRALRATKSKAAAARKLKVGRSTLYREIGRRGIKVVKMMMIGGGDNDN
jgi:transcriptional regulator with PAS, ATPase and Fis domain